MKVLFENTVTDQDFNVDGVEFMITDLGVYITIANKYVRLEKYELEKVLKLL